MSFFDRFKHSQAEVVASMPQNPYDIGLSAEINVSMATWKERMQMMGGRATIDDQRDITCLIDDVIREREKTGDTCSVSETEKTVRAYIFSSSV